MHGVTQLTSKDLEGKKVLVAADLDVPIKEGQVEDDLRLRGVVKTTKYLISRGASVILVGHLGRPDGKIVEELRLDPVAQELGELLAEVPVIKLDEVWGGEVREMADGLNPGQVLVLENVRFDPREEANDVEFARKLAGLADLFVNEIFSTSHREHASIVGVPKFLPAYAGIRLSQEVEVLLKIRNDPERPLVFVVGGSKKGKVDFVKNIAFLADHILLGGTLMFAQELEGVPKVMFPVDAVRIDDIGPKSIKAFCRRIKQARTIVWVGPLGRFEEEEYLEGTRRIAQCIIESGCFSVAGGGDTLAALKELEVRERFGFCSTGGGAMLEFLAKGTLPGIEVLSSDD